ncbi:MAG: hypothetical protein Q4B50_07100, partial [Bacillota bacterium]|nr:hypothetical protein [Bacillota bacterium]
MKKSVLLILILGVLICFSACGGSGETGNSGSLVSSDYVYVPEYFPLPSNEMDNVDNISYYDGKLYFSSYGVVGTREPSAEELEWTEGVVEEWMTELYGTAFYSVNLDGSEFTRLEGFEPSPLPEGMMGDTSVNSFTLDHEGNFWILENQYVYTYDEDGAWLDGGESFFLRKLDSNGTEIGFIDLEPVVSKQEWFYANGLSVDKQGFIYVCSENTVFVMDPSTGSLAFEVMLEGDGWINTIVALSNGKVGASLYDANGNYLIKEIDVESKAFGKEYKLPPTSYELYSGGGEYLVYCSDANYLYGVKADSGESVALLNWIDSDINTNDMRNVIPLEDGRIICFNQTYSYDEDGNYTGSQEVVALTKTPAADVPEKKILTLATMWLDYNIRSAV